MASDAIYDRFIINTSDDVYVFGLDAETGELAWEDADLRLHGDLGPAQLRTDNT